MEQNLQNIPEQSQINTLTYFEQTNNNNQPIDNLNNQQVEDNANEPQNNIILQRAFYKSPILKFSLKNKLFFIFFLTFILGVLCCILTLKKQISTTCEITQIIILLQYFCLIWQYYYYSSITIWGLDNTKLNLFLISSYILFILSLIGLNWQIEYGLSIIRMLLCLFFCTLYQITLIEYNR